MQRIDERMAAIREQQTKLDRRDNELRAKKKKLSELKGKKRQLEQKISTKQDRYLLPKKHQCVSFFRIISRVCEGKHLIAIA